MKLLSLPHSLKQYTCRLAFFMLLLLSMFTLGLAQISIGGTPSMDRLTLRTTAVGEGRRVVTLTPPSYSEFEAFSKEHSGKNGEFRIQPVGMPIATDFTPSNSGVISSTTDGRLTWQLAIHSQDARSLQLIFGKYHLEPGARLFLLSPEGDVIRGAFTDTNNTELGSLAIAPVESDALILHYEGPQGSDQLPDLHLTQIVYGFLSLGDFLKESSTSNNSLRWGEPGFYENETIACAPPIISKPEVASQAQSEVLLLLRGSSFCSGALINNTAKDGTAYILTAAHCMNAAYKRQGDIKYANNTAELTVVFFNYKSPLLNPVVRGCEEQSLAGAKIVAMDEDLDMCLLKIVGTDPNPLWKKSGGIPASFMPYYSGWNVANDHPEGPFVGIHHPRGNVTRYSRCNATSLKHLDLDLGAFKFKDAHYLIEHWDVGTTEGGSSGSPLFDKNMRIVGALTGGNSHCSSPFNDYYYILAHGFNTDKEDNKRLKPWLDPINKGVLQVDGFWPYQELSPERLSYNLSSLHRDLLDEKSKYSPEGVSGIASSYKLKQRSRLLGAFVQADFSNTNVGDVKVVLYAQSPQGDVRKIKEMPFKYPRYRQISYFSDKLQARTPGHVEFYLPFATGSSDDNFPILGKNEVLMVAFETAGTQLLIRICRNKPSTGETGSTYFRLAGEAGYIRANNASLGSERVYMGNYWIDPVILPLEKKQDSLVPKLSVPTAYLFAGQLRVMVPKEFEKGADITIYAMDGRRLYTHHVPSGESEVALPEVVTSERSVVLYFSFEGKNYGTVAFPYLGK